MIPHSTRDSRVMNPISYRSKSPPREGHRSCDAPGGCLTRRGRARESKIPCARHLKLGPRICVVGQVTRERQKSSSSRDNPGRVAHPTTQGVLQDKGPRQRLPQSRSSPKVKFYQLVPQGGYPVIPLREEWLGVNTAWTSLVVVD